MKEFKVARAMGHIDEQLIADAMLASEKGIMGGKRKMKSYSNFTRWAAFAAVFAILLSGGLLFGGLARGAEALVALDVNPSIELEVNKKEEIRRVHALNDEAAAVIGDMELEGVDLDVAINAVIGSMVKLGYLTTERNSILISVDSANEEKAAALKQKLSTEVGALLAGSNIEASVITQSFDKKGEDKAEENHISAAKSSLIGKIIDSGLLDASGVPYSYERLVPLKVNELKLILESKAAEVAGVEASGNAGTGDYIGAERALELALADAGIATSDVGHHKVEMDYDDDIRAMVYEVQFTVGNIEYEYELRAENGKILERETEPKDNKDKNNKDDKDNIPVTEGESTLTREKALAIAYKDAGLAENEVRRPEIELEREMGRLVYEIEFKSGGSEYEYTLDAESGEILKKETEKDD